MGNQIKLFGNPKLFVGPDDGNRGGSIVSIFDGKTQFASISTNRNFDLSAVAATQPGISFWYRLKQLETAPLPTGEPRILLFHVDTDETTWGCVATVDLNGNVYWYFKHNGMIYSRYAKAVFPILERPDYAAANYASTDYYTVVGEESFPSLPYRDLVFDYKFANRIPKIFVDGKDVTRDEIVLQMGGTSDLVTLNNNAVLNNLSSFTFSFWIYMTSYGPSSTPHIITKGYPGNNTIIIYTNSANGQLNFRIQGSDGSLKNATTVPGIGLNAWHHFICKYDISTGTIRIRKNGVQDSGTVQTAVTAGAIGGTSNLVLNAGGGNVKWAGKIDELKFWRSNLSDADCNKVYNDDPTAPIPDYYIPFNEGSGTTVTDQIGGFTGTISGSTSWGKGNYTGITIPDPPFPVPLSVNAKQYVDMSASGEDIGFEAVKADDSNLTTLWKVTSGFGSWLKAEIGELGQVTVVTLVKIAWYLGNARRYTFVVEVSQDNVVWTQVYAGQSSGTTTGLEEYNFADILGRFVRVTVNGNTVNNEAGIYEFQVFGGMNQSLPEEGPSFEAFTAFYNLPATGSAVQILADGITPPSSPFYSVPLPGTPNWNPLNRTIFKRGEWAANSGSDLIGKKPTKISVWLRRVGSPTGTVTVAIRKKSDLSLRKLFGSKDVTTIATTGTEYFFENVGDSYTIQADDVVLIEYSEAVAANNNIEVAFTSSNAYDVDSWKIRNDGGVWIETTTSDMCGTMAEGSIPGTNLKKRATIVANAPDSILVNKLITKFTIYLAKSGNPTGTVRVCVRSGQDDSMRTDYMTIPASTLTTTMTPYTVTKTDANFRLQYQDHFCIDYEPPSGTNSTSDQVLVRVVPDSIDGAKTCIKTYSNTYDSPDTSRDVCAILYQGGQQIDEGQEAIAALPSYSKDLFINAGFKGTDLSLPGNLIGFNNCIACEFHIYWLNPTELQALNYFLNRLTISSIANGSVAVCGYAVFTS